MISFFAGRLTSLMLAASVSSVVAAQGPLHPSHKVPVEKQLSQNWERELYSDDRKEFRGEQLNTIGMPCGGIAAGQLYVRGDGTLAQWWIANNAYNTGYGVDSLTRFDTPLGPMKVCYQTFRPPSFFDQGFELDLDYGSRKRSIRLNQEELDDISFVGEYPIAKITYASKSDPLPLAVGLEVFSPFIPMNARESATPGTVLRYTLKNTSSQPVRASLNGWLQNLVCLEIAGELNADSRNRIEKQHGMVSLLMDLSPRPPVATAKPRLRIFDDFESGYRKWKVSGEAFGKAPAKGSFGGDQSRITGFSGTGLVNSFLKGDKTTGKMISETFTIADDYIVFRLGGGNHPKTTCMNLVVNGQVVQTATGRSNEGLEGYSWDVKKWRGKTAHLEIIDEEKGGWGHINVDDISFSDLPLTKEKYFPYAHPYNGNLALTLLSEQAYGDADYAGAADAQKSDTAKRIIGDKLVGAVGTDLLLQPNETKELTFLLTWFFPNRPSYFFGNDVTDIISNNWNEALPAKDATILGNMYANWFSSSMDVARWLHSNLARLSAETHAFHNAYYNNNTLPYWLIQRIMMPASTLATETCQWWANDKFWAWEGVGSCVGTCTHVWNYEQALARLFPSLERNIREKTDFESSFQKDGSVLARNGWGGVLIDGHAGAILKAYREYLHSKDALFLSRNWDKIKKATEFLIREDGNGDGLIEKVQANTYDIAFFGPNTYVGSLYLAALKAAAAMARVMEDKDFADRCLRIQAAGEQNTVKKLWNGEYFVQEVDLKKHPEFQYATGCLSDQLFGQTWSHLNRLGYIYPQEQVRKTLKSIWKYNWTQDVATQNSVHPPERTYANAGEAGLLICTWPKSMHMGEAGVRYRDEVWTGIEYQVATNMIYEDMLFEGLSIVKAIHDRYSPEKHNPWNEIECGDHYARAMASWGVLVALQDFFYNGPEKALHFAPKLRQHDFKSFFTAAEGWGNIGQQRSDKQQLNTINVKYGRLSLKKVEVEAAAPPSRVRVTVNGSELNIQHMSNGKKLIVHFDETVLEKNSVLTITIDF